MEKSYSAPFVSFFFVLGAISHAFAGVDVHLVILNDNGYENSYQVQSFLHSACKLGFGKIKVVNDWCPSRSCQSDDRLLQYLYSLPDQDWVTIIHLEKNYLYLMSRREKLINRLESELKSPLLISPPMTSQGNDLSPVATSEGSEPSPVVTSEGNDPMPVVTSEGNDPMPIVTSEMNDPNPVVTSELNDPSPVMTSEMHDPSPVMTSGGREPSQRPELNAVLKGGGVVIGRVKDVSTLITSAGNAEKEDKHSKDAEGEMRGKGTKTEGVEKSKEDSKEESSKEESSKEESSRHVVYMDRINGKVGLSIPLEVKFESDDGRVSTTPVILARRTDEPDFFNAVELDAGSKDCPGSPFQPLNLKEKDTPEYPTVLLWMSVPSWQPFFEEVLAGVTSQDYPKTRIHFRLSIKSGTHSREVSALTTTYSESYASLETVEDDGSGPRAADPRDICEKISCDFLLDMSSSVYLRKKSVFTDLISENRPCVGPLLKDAERKRFNILTPENQVPSTLLSLILQKSYRGTFRVSGLSGLTAVRRTSIASKDGCFMVNKENYGLLMNPMEEIPGKLNSDLWGQRHNPLVWGQRYIQPDLLEVIGGRKEAEMIGPYLYYVPFYTKRFCDDLVDESERHGNWTDPDSTDTRDVPHQYTSRNINLEDLGFDEAYRLIINSYQKRLNEALFKNFSSTGEPNLIFVLKYSGGQKYNTFKYHLDGGTYTYNIALNDDFTGGGVQYKFGNHFFEEEWGFSVDHKRVGWAVVQPDQPIHVHRGIPLDSGTRYALINIINTRDDGCKGGPSTYF